MHRIRVVRNFCYAKAGDLGDYTTRLNAQICDYAKVNGNIRLDGGVVVSENALLSGPLNIHGALEICGKAEIRSPRHISTQSNPVHEIGSLAFFREANGKIGIAYKRFCGFSWKHSGV